MIKHMFILGALSTGILFLSACVSEVQDDILSYLNGDKMEELAQMEQEILADYDSLSASAMDDLEVATFLEESVIRPYSEFIKELEDFEINTAEVQEIHDIYIDATNYQYEGFLVIKEGLEASDIAIVEEGNEFLAEGRALIERYTNELETLADEHDIELEER